MGEYYIDYGTGIGNEAIVGTLEDAMAAADDGAAYTQQDINIYHNDNIVASREWRGVAPDDASDDVDLDGIIQFGDWGYYEPWAM